MYIAQETRVLTKNALNVTNYIIDISLHIIYTDEHNHLIIYTGVGPRHK